MKKTTITTGLVLLLAGLGANVLVAYPGDGMDEDMDYRPRRPLFRRDMPRHQDFWKDRMLRRTLSINAGLWAALSANIDSPDLQGSDVEFRDPDWLFSIGAKLWFYESRFGIGLDAILLDRYVENIPSDFTYWDRYGNLVTHTGTAKYTISKWMVDLDLYYRLPLSPRLQAVGGLGLTYFVFDSGGAPGYVSSRTEVGYNLKAGAEYFVDREISITGMFTWHDFHQGAVYVAGSEEATVLKMFSFGVQVNLYL